MDDLNQQPIIDSDLFLNNSQDINSPKDYKMLRAILVTLILIIWSGSLLLIVLFLSSNMDYQAGSGIGMILGKYIIIALFISLFLSLINVILVHKAKQKRVLVYILLILSLIFSIGLLLFYNIVFKQDIQMEKDYGSATKESIKSIDKAKISEIEFPSNINENIFQQGQLIRKVNFAPGGSGEFSKEIYYLDEDTQSLKEYRPSFWIQNGIERATQYSPSFQRLVLTNNTDEYILLDFKIKKAFKFEDYSGPNLIIDKSTGVIYVIDNYSFDHFIFDEEKLEFVKTSQSLLGCDNVNTINQEDNLKQFLDKFGLSTKQNLFKDIATSIEWVGFGESKQLGLTGYRELFFSDSNKKELYIIDGSAEDYSFGTMCNTNE